MRPPITWVPNDGHGEQALLGPYVVGTVYWWNSQWKANFLMPARLNRKWTTKNFESMDEAKQWIDLLVQSWFKSIGG